MDEKNEQTSATTGEVKQEPVAVDEKMEYKPTAVQQIYKEIKKRLRKLLKKTFKFNYFSNGYFAVYIPIPLLFDSRLMFALRHARKPVEPLKIVFDNYMGKGYGCNPKYVAEKLEEKYPGKFEIVWVVTKTDALWGDIPEHVRQVNYGSPKALKEYATAKVWVSNYHKISFLKRGLFKRKGQFFIQMWHGSLGIKKIENDVSGLTKKKGWLKMAKRSYERLAVKKDGAVMTLSFNSPANTELYVRLSGFDINNSGQSSFTVKVCCEDIAENMYAKSNKNNWYFGRENYLANLGYSEEERTTCTIAFPKKGNYKLDDIQLFALPMDRYPEQIEALKAEPLENILWETNKVSGTVDLSKDKILCMSIPYSKGWTAKVDGQKVEILKGNYMFMALPLVAGYHDIEFTYCSPGLKVGIAASLFSVGMVSYLVCKERKKRQAL